MSEQSTPDVLSARIILIGCSLANPVREVALRDEEGNPIAYRVVPRRYQFHSGPCPFGKAQPDQGCRFCVLHTEQALAYRALSEGEADTLTDEKPEAWRPIMPTRLES